MRPSRPAGSLSRASPPARRRGTVLSSRCPASTWTATSGSLRSATASRCAARPCPARASPGWATAARAASSALLSASTCRRHESRTGEVRSARGDTDRSRAPAGASVRSVEVRDPGLGADPRLVPEVRGLLEGDGADDEAVHRAHVQLPLLQCRPGGAHGPRVPPPLVAHRCRRAGPGGDRRSARHRVGPPCQRGRRATPDRPSRPTPSSTRGRAARRRPGRPARTPAPAAWSRSQSTGPAWRSCSSLSSWLIRAPLPKIARVVADSHRAPHAAGRLPQTGDSTVLDNAAMSSSSDTRPDAARGSDSPAGSPPARAPSRPS